MYEQGKKKFLVITERALYFQNVRLRYARNLIFYSLPESTRVFEELVGLNSLKGARIILKLRYNQRKKRKENTGEEQDEPTEAEEKKLVMGESVIFGLFSPFDDLKLERLVGTEGYNPILYNKTKETFQFL